MEKNILYALNINIFQDKALFTSLYNEMDEDRRVKIDRFKTEGDKLRSLGAGVLLKEGLRQLGARDARIVLSDNGKPAPLNMDFSFNISHAKDIVICAFSDKEIGADIECTRKFSDGLVSYAFSQKEIETFKLGTMDEDERNCACTRLWTAKESIMKYSGKGISMNAKDICLDSVALNCYSNKVDIKSDFKIYYKDEELQNIFLSGHQYEDYYISVCSEIPDYNMNIKWYNP